MIYIILFYFIVYLFIIFIYFQTLKINMCEILNIYTPKLQLFCTLLYN